MRLRLMGRAQMRSTIDAQQQSRIFDITAITGDYTFDRLTLTGGRTTGRTHDRAGGAVQSFSVGTLTIDDCSIDGNDTSVNGSGPGGGVFAQGNVALLRSTISGNKSWSGGGGIYAGGNITAFASTISDNGATIAQYGGGGIYCQGSVMLTETNVSGNKVGGSSSGFRAAGGGIHCDQDVVLIRSSIDGNSAGSGGGVFARGHVTVDHGTIGGNMALRGNGGGVYALGFTIYGDIGASNVTITSSNIAGNTASRHGGGICAGNIDPFAAVGSVTIEESTISGNAAGQAGGGVYCSGAVSLASSKVDGNTINGTQFAYAQYSGGAAFLRRALSTRARVRFVATRFHRRRYLALPVGECDRGRPSPSINARSAGTMLATAAVAEWRGRSYQGQFEQYWREYRL